MMKHRGNKRLSRSLLSAWMAFTLTCLPAMAKPKEFTTEAGETMVLIPGGTFAMGPSGKSSEVEVDAFYMAKHPVTQASFQRVMGTNQSRWRANDHPMDSVTFAGAAEYCNKLSEIEGLEPVYNTETWEINYEANGYRLPTEAEWEFAARGGTNTRFFWGDEPARVGLFAWVRNNSGQRTRPVGRKMPNPYGLHDIYGNVSEWCNDIFEENYRPKEGAVNPKGPEEGRLRVVRGGSWSSSPEEANSIYRSGAEPGYADVCIAGYDVYGFRIVRPVRDSE